MKIVARECVIIKDCTPQLEKFFTKQLTFANPEYYKKLNQGRYVGNTPQNICLYERRGRDLYLPFGMLPTIFKSYELSHRTINTIHAPEKHEYGSGIIPYQYQENAIKAALRAKQGIVVAPCGAGKTQIGLEIAARLGMRTLWLTHTHELLNQSMERAKGLFALSEKDYGTITGGKVDIGNVITFATVQTMAKLDLPNYRDCWDVVIVDEAHHCVGTPTKLMMFYKVVSNLSARYKYGLTATPDRADGLTPCMYALIGNLICEIGKHEVEHTTCPVVVDIRQTEYTADIEAVTNPDGTLNYVQFINNIAADEARNQMIASDALKCAGSVLILTDRVSQAQRLKTLIGASCAVLAAAKKKERGEVLEQLANGEIKVLVATFQLAREGLDVPSLRNVIFATPQKNEQIITQAAGRVARCAEGKEFGTLIDYEDAFGILRGWQKKRIAIYKKLGYSFVE